MAPAQRVQPASPAVADSVLVHRRLCHVVAEQSELRLDSRCSPRRVLKRHASNQLADLLFGPKTAHLSVPGLSSSVQLEALPRPTDNRFRLDDDEGKAPIRPQAGKPGSEDPVALPEPRPL